MTFFGERVCGGERPGAFVPREADVSVIVDRRRCGKEHNFRVGSHSLPGLADEFHANAAPLVRAVHGGSDMYLTYRKSVSVLAIPTRRSPCHAVTTRLAFCSIDCIAVRSSTGLRSPSVDRR